MTVVTLSRGLAAFVGAIAVLNAMAELSMPVVDRARGPLVVAATLALLASHAALYWAGGRVRSRFGLPGYVIGQAALLFLIALTKPPAPVMVSLFMAGTAELVALAGDRWGTIRITLGAIALFVLASLVTADLYRATTAGLLFALSAAVAHALAGLLQRPAAAPPAPDPAPGREPGREREAAGNGPSGLSAREVEVLQALVRGARNSAIAAELGITERTVKAHLGSIYQKLGVDSRSAAVAAALRRNLV